MSKTIASISSTTAETHRAPPSQRMPRPHAISTSAVRLLRDCPAPLALTPIALLVTLLNFRTGLPIGFADGGLGQFLYDPGHWLQDSFYGWDPSMNLGGAYGISPATTVLLPLTATWTALARLGLSSWAIQTLYIFGILEAALLFSFYAIRRTLAASSRPRSASLPFAAPLVGSIATVFNLYSATTYWRLFDLNVALIALVPFLIWLINKAFDGARVLTLSILLAVGLIVLSPAFSNLAYIPPVAVLTITYAAWRATLVRRPTCRPFLRLAAASLVALLADASIYGPAILSSLTAYSAPTANLLSNSLVLSVSSAQASIWNVLRGMVVSPSNDLWLGKDPSWRYFYSTPIGLALGVLLLALAVVGLRTRETRRCAGYALLVLSLGALGAMGSAGPTGALFLWCFAHVPAFTLLRIPYLAFAPFLTVGFGLATAAGAQSVLSACQGVRARSSVFEGRGLHRIRQWRPTNSHVTLLILALLVGYAFPLTVGLEVPEPITIHGPTITSTVKVPPDYIVVRRYLASHDLAGSRVLALPLSEATNVALRWRNGYDGPNDDYLLLHAPTVAFLSSGVDPWEVDFIRALDVSALPALINAAAILGCRYVLLQADALAEVYGGPGGDEALSVRANRGAIAHFIKSARAALAQLQARRVLTAGQLTLYQLPSALVRPQVYSVATAAGSEAPTIQAHPVTPTEWIVTATGGRGGWYLVLNAQTDTGWRMLRSTASPRDSLNPVSRLLGRLALDAAGVSMARGISVAQVWAGGEKGSTVLPAGMIWPEFATGSGKQTIVLIFAPELWHGLANLLSILGWSCVGMLLGRRYIYVPLRRLQRGSRVS